MDTTREGEWSKLMEATSQTMEKSSAVARTEGGSSKLMEATEPMEESSVFESEPTEEIEESDDDYVNSNDEYLTATWWTAPEWDVDSFDGREYDSPQEINDFSDEELEKKWRRFNRQIFENKGFFVEPELWPFHSYSDFILVRDLESSAGFGQTHREYFAEMACLCLKKYNEEKGLNVEFHEVVRGIFSTGSRSKSYITFMAREKPDGPPVEYQAKVWCTFVQGENYPILCRPAPKSKPFKPMYTS